MVEHEAWVGTSYEDGLKGCRVAIVGWSHWGDEAEDLGTVECIKRVMSGEWPDIRFFNQIRGYFGYEHHGDFWPQVAFFNYLPTLVGDGSQRFGHGTVEQRSLGQERFERLIGLHQPEKTVIFTSRRWAFPAMQDTGPLSHDLPQFLRGKYNFGSHETTAFFIRHPQGASKDVMMRAVKIAIDA